MKNILDSIRLQIHDRLSSPLFGSFVIAWVAWNHRFLAVLFSNLTVTEKFKVIDQIHAGFWRTWGFGIIYPLISSLLFILVYPYPAKWIYGYWLRRQREQKALRDEIEGATLLTEEESKKVRMDMLRNVAEYEEVIRKQAEEIRMLRSQADNKKPAQAVQIDGGHADQRTEPKAEIPEGTLTRQGLRPARLGNYYRSCAWKRLAALRPCLVGEMPSVVTSAG